LISADRVGFNDLADLGWYADRDMKRKSIGLIFAFLFILSGAAAAYNHCAQASHDLDSATEHGTSQIHCPHAVLVSSNQTNLGNRSYSDNIGTTPPSSQLRLAANLFAPWSSKVHLSFDSFSQQGLYRFEEVYRL